MFNKDMTINEAIEKNSDAGLVFANYHLGGCAYCSINEYETIEQVCDGYGIELEKLLKDLNDISGI